MVAKRPVSDPSRHQRDPTIHFVCPTTGRTNLLVALLTMLATLLAPLTTQAQEYTYAECDAIEPAALETEIETLARAVLDEGQNHLDIDAIVERQWDAVGMDQALGHEVDLAVRQLMVDKPYWERFWSGWSGEKAEEFATTIAERVFSSPSFSAKLDELSLAIADDIAVELEAMAARSASTSFLCVQQYVGDRYSESMLSLFEMEIQRDMDNVDFDAAQDELVFSQFDSHNKAAFGASIIVVSQLVRRISVSLGKKVAGRVAGRIAGRLLGRLGSSLIPFAGWVVGGGLILWDLYEGGKGSLPQIQESLKSEDVKAMLRAEVVLAVEEGLSDEIDLIAGQIAQQLAAMWFAFCEKHAYLCTLPEESTDFQMILDATSVEDLEKLAQLVDIFLATLGRIQLDSALQSGLFEDLLALPGGALTLLQETGSVDLVLTWAELAGPRLEEVASSQLYRHIEPSLITGHDIPMLLSLDEPDLVRSYAGLDDEVRFALKALSEADRRWLLDNVRQSDIDWLFHHADVEGLVFPLLASRVVDGTVTVDQLRSPPDSAEELAAVVPFEIDLPLSNGGAVEEGSGARQNSVFVAALILSVILAISTFALGTVRVVKRRKQ